MLCLPDYALQATAGRQSLLTSISHEQLRASCRSSSIGSLLENTVVQHLTVLEPKQVCSTLDIFGILAFADKQLQWLNSRLYSLCHVFNSVR